MELEGSIDHTEGYAPISIHTYRLFYLWDYHMKASITHEPDLDDYRSRIRKCMDELQKIDFVLRGSIVKHYMRCGTMGCKCRADPPVLHGPYYDWTRKVRGKTVTVRLKEHEAEILQEWISNIRKLDKIVSRMVKISMEAVEKIRN